MVKGVNKTIIEVNDTGSKIFEKIVFYVTPQYGALNAKQLRRATREFSFSFSGQDGKTDKSTLKRSFFKETKKSLYVMLGALSIVVTAILILLL